MMAKELEILKCVLPDKIVAGCIVAKFLPSWRNFATSLKHQRHGFSIENIIGSMDVEHKAREKYTHWWSRGTLYCQFGAEKFLQVSKEQGLPEYQLQE
jgi:hypothetical protein